MIIVVLIMKAVCLVSSSSHIRMLLYFRIEEKPECNHPPTFPIPFSKEQSNAEASEEVDNISAFLIEAFVGWGSYCVGQYSAEQLLEIQKRGGSETKVNASYTCLNIACNQSKGLIVIYHNNKFIVHICPNRHNISIPYCSGIHIILYKCCYVPLHSLSVSVSLSPSLCRSNLNLVAITNLCKSTNST